jgi:hypothetical protein
VPLVDANIPATIELVACLAPAAFALVALVFAIGESVAAPLLWYTIAVVAFEFVVSTLCVRVARQWYALREGERAGVVRQ